MGKASLHIFIKVRKVGNVVKVKLLIYIICLLYPLYENFINKYYIISIAHGIKVVGTMFLNLIKRKFQF